MSTWSIASLVNSLYIARNSVLHACHKQTYRYSRKGQRSPNLLARDRTLRDTIADFLQEKYVETCSWVRWAEYVELRWVPWKLTPGIPSKDGPLVLIHGGAKIPIEARNDKPLNRLESLVHTGFSVYPLAFPLCCDLDHKWRDVVWILFRVKRPSGVHSSLSSLVGIVVVEAGGQPMT